MRVFLFLLTICLFTACAKEKAHVDGEWAWEFTNAHGESHQAMVELKEMDDTKVVGYYCSSFGSKVDCANGENKSHNFELVRISPIEFLGTIRSNFLDDRTVAGRIKLTYFPVTDELSFDILEEPSGVFYFPDEVEFKRQ